MNKSLGQDFSRAETLSLPITLADPGAGVRLAGRRGPALAARADRPSSATLGLIGLVSQLLPMDGAISSVVLLIGLAVGVDYSLFYLRREREERAAGASDEAALRAAAATSGRAILVSGFTVMIAMAGMFFAGSRVFTSFAVGTIMVVAVAMVGSLTVLPAMMSALGSRVDKGRIPLLHRLRRRAPASRACGASCCAPVMRRPGIAAAVSAARAGRARAARAEHADRAARGLVAAAQHPDREDLRPDPEGVPRRIRARRMSASRRATCARPRSSARSPS